jgi:hypothetical protein
MIPCREAQLGSSKMNFDRNFDSNGNSKAAKTHSSYDTVRWIPMIYFVDRCYDIPMDIHLYNLWYPSKYITYV